MMGDNFGDGAASEKPVHRVCLDDFKIDKYEVSQAAFQMATGHNPSKHYGCPNCPVDQATWEEAREFCAKAGKRLPTEAEWEYAARNGGKKVKFANGRDKMARGDTNYQPGSISVGGLFEMGLTVLSASAKSSDSSTKAVGSYASSELGLYDMAGNVWEWTSDWHAGEYYKTSPANNPQGPPTSMSTVYRVIRGGSYTNFEYWMRASNRDRNSPGVRSAIIGFRCAQ